MVVVFHCSFDVANLLYSSSILGRPHLKLALSFRTLCAATVLMTLHSFAVNASDIAAKHLSRRGSESELEATNLGKWYLENH